MEIILNILLFSILLCVSLQFIMKAHDLTIRSTQLERAVTTCNNLASIYESTSGTGEGVLETYDYAVSVGDHLFVYFDKNFIPCEFEDAVYTVSITPVSADTKRLHSAEITC